MGARRRDPLIAAVMLVVLFAPAAPAAQEAGGVRSEAEVERIGDRLDGELMSPFCHGLTLASCPTGSAAELRGEIREWLRQGRSEEWIRDTLVARYGEGILGAPRFRGLGVLVWVLPAAVLLLAAAGVVGWMRRHLTGETGRIGKPAFPGSGADAEARRRAAARVERDLRKIDDRP